MQPDVCLALAYHATVARAASRQRVGHAPGKRFPAGMWLAALLPACDDFVSSRRTPASRAHNASWILALPPMARSRPPAYLTAPAELLVQSAAARACLAPRHLPVLQMLHGFDPFPAAFGERPVGHPEHSRRSPSRSARVLALRRRESNSTGNSCAHPMPDAVSKMGVQGYNCPLQ